MATVAKAEVAIATRQEETDRCAPVQLSQAGLSQVDFDGRGYAQARRDARNGSMAQWECWFAQGVGMQGGSELIVGVRHFQGDKAGQDSLGR